MDLSCKWKSIYRWSDLARILGLALTYAILAKIVLSFFSANSVVSVVWPSSGLALAALLMGGKKYWPGIFIGALIGNLLQDSPFQISFFIAIGNTLEALACMWLLAHVPRFQPDLKQPRDILWLGLSGALGSCLSALIGVTTLVLNGVLTNEDVAKNLLDWWQGDMLGIVLVTPMILVWRHFPYDWFKRDRITETIICFGLAFLSGQIVFLGWLNDIFGVTARGYWVFLFVTWCALRFGRHGALLIIAMTATQMLLGMVLAVGGVTNNQVPVGLLNFWLYMLVLTCVGLSLALVIDKLKSTDISLCQSRDLFSKISQRVPGVIYQFRRTPDGRSSIPFASKAIFDMFAVKPEHVNEDASAVFETVYPADYDGVMASIDESARTLSLWQYEFRVVLPSRGVCWRLGEAHPEKLEDGSVLWHGFITDITERKQSEERIQRLTKLYKALGEINQAIVRMEKKEELFPLVCRCAIELGGMKLAWIGQLDQATGMVTPVASAGDSADYLKNLRVSSSLDAPEGLSTTGTAIRENRPVIVNDFLQNPMTMPWKAHADRIGWASAAAFPIQRGGVPFAVLTVCHEQANAFDSENIELLKEISKDISFALDNFDRELQRIAGEESLQLAASVYKTSSEGILITDADNWIIAINQAFTKITGYEIEEVLGQNSLVFNSDHQDEDFLQNMRQEIEVNGEWEGEVWDRRKNGEVYTKWLNINSIYNDTGSVQRRVVMFTDITQKRETEQLIWHQANYDFLTALPNRQMFHDRLDQEMKTCNRAGLQLALLFIDIDHFKEVNDTLGHDLGDALLKEVALRLRGCVREIDTVSRLGGDEFTIILGSLDDHDVVQRVAQNILNKMSVAFHLGNEAMHVSASIGITLYPEDATTIEALLINADQAMYAAKQMGRNRFHYFTQAMQKNAQNRLRLTNELHGALAESQFRLFYQPIIEMSTNVIHKAEALIRWQHPERGIVSPLEFIPIAEETGLIIEIGEWVFLEAVQQASIWRKSLHPDFQISINKSPVQIRDEALKYPTWPKQLQELGLSGQSIVVEITESLLMDASNFINNKLLAFRDAGIQVALDDFGTGYSSLSYLKKFDIDYLKIDQSFTRNLAPNSDDMALCEAIIVMAHKLGMKVIAEGIETEQQRELLFTAGCDYGQGYLFSKPIPATEFEALFKRYK